jgi:hypothetical protein
MLDTGYWMLDSDILMASSIQYQESSIQGGAGRYCSGKC